MEECAPGAWGLVRGQPDVVVEVAIPLSPHLLLWYVAILGVRCENGGAARVDAWTFLWKCSMLSG